MKKKILVVGCLVALTSTINASWKHALIGGGIGYILGKSGNQNCDESYNNGFNNGKLEALNGLKRIIISSEKKKYTKEELIQLLSN